MGRGLVAVLAALLGIGVLGYAAVQLVGQISDRRSAPPSTQAFPDPPATTQPDLPLDTVPITVDTPTPTFTSGPLETMTVVDDSGRLSVDVPATWSDVSTSAWISRDEPIGIRINAAVDRAAWFDGWDTPGAFIGVTSERTAEELFGSFDDDCTYASRFPVPIGITATGEADLWILCGDERSDLIVVVAKVGTPGEVMLIQVVIVDSDWTGFTSILQSVAYQP